MTVPEKWRIGRFQKSLKEKLNWLYDEVEDVEEAVSDLEENALPEVSGSDNGKLLGVSSGEWAVVDAPEELPSVTTSDNGKVLMVLGGTWCAWENPSALPPVTGDDNGDILTVVNGRWDKVTPNASVGTLTVYFTVDWDDQTQSATITCNKTIEEVETAMSDGYTIDARLVYYNSMGWYTPVKVFYGMPFTYAFDFVVIDPTYNGLSYVQVWFDGVSYPMKWTVTDSPFTLTPYTPT